MISDKLAPIVFVAIGVISPILFRLRGSSLIKLTDNETRLLIWSWPMAVAMWVVFGGKAWLIIPYMGGWYAGLTVAPWGVWTDLGQTDGKPIRDWLLLSVRGVLVNIFAGGVLCLLSIKAGLTLALLGAFMSVAYKIGQLIPSRIPNLNQGREMGEIFTGLFIAFGMCAAYLVMRFVHIHVYI